MRYLPLLALVAIVIVSGCVVGQPGQSSQPSQITVPWESAGQQETGGESLSKETKVISITDFSTNPNTLTISPGTTVMWYNNDKEPHKLIEKNRFFESGDIAPGGNWTMRFTTPGRYSYKCAYHSSVIGTIIVQ